MSFIQQTGFFFLLIVSIAMIPKNMKKNTEKYKEEKNAATWIITP